MKYTQNFDKRKNFDELIVGFIGETLKELQVSREKFDKSLVIHQIC